MYGDGEKMAIEAYEGHQDGLFSSMTCCTSFKKDAHNRPFSYEENPVTLVFDQPKPVDSTINYNYFPGHYPPPNEPKRPATSVKKQTMPSRSRRGNQFKDAFSRPWTSHHKRPVIGAPTNFRKLTNFDLSESPPVARLRPVPGRRFRPLELSIYMPDNRLSPLPDFSMDEWSMPANLSLPPPAILRDTSILVDDGVSSQFDIRRDVIQTEIEDANSPSQSFDNATPVLRQDRFSGLPGLAIGYQEMPYTPQTPTMNRSSSASARPQTAISPRSPESGSFHSRSFSDLVRPLRSSGSISRPRLDNVDEAIRELNTIVEERRHSAIQKSVQQEEGPMNVSPLRHIPAIAPSMIVRARSQTLTDIGSAFSTPFSGPGPVRPSTNSGNTTVVGSPLTSPSPALTKTSSMSSKSKLRTWFSRSASNASRTTYATQMTPNRESTEEKEYRSMTRFSTTSSVTDGPTEDVFSPTTVVSGHSLGYAGTTLTSVTTPLVSPAAYEEKEINSMYAFPHPLHSHTVYPHSWIHQERPVMPLRFQQQAMIQQQQEGAYYSPAVSYYTSSNESSPAKVNGPTHRLTASRRGLSVDTIMTTSSIGTSILGGEGPQKARNSQVRISGVDTWEDEEMLVGVAF